MGLLDGPMRQLAKVLVTTLGGTAALSRPEVGDVESGSWNIVTTPLESAQGENVFRAGGSSLQKGDIKTSIPAKALSDEGVPAPEMGFSLTKDDIEYWIKEVKPLRSGDEIALYDISAISVPEILRRANHTIQIYAPQEERTATGGKSPTGFSLVKEVTGAWVQPVSSAQDEQYMTNKLTTMSHVFTSEDPQALPGYRVVFGTKKMRVLNIVNELNAGKLWVMTVEG